MMQELDGQRALRSARSPRHPHAVAEWWCSGGSFAGTGVGWVWAAEVETSVASRDASRTILIASPSRANEAKGKFLFPKEGRKVFSRCPNNVYIGIKKGENKGEISRIERIGV